MYNWGEMFRRKLITASLTASLYSLFFGFIALGPYSVQLDSVSKHPYEYFTGILFNSVYIFSFVFIYGIATSSLTEFLITKFNFKPRVLLMGVGHSIFGLIFWYFSLIPAMMFFLIDQILFYQKNKNNKFLIVISILLPIVIFIVSKYFSQVYYNG